MSNSHFARIEAAKVYDDTGFWKINRTVVGAGYSSNTYAHTLRPNGRMVNQRYYQPGPWHRMAHPAKPELWEPHSTYSVYCGVHGLADEAAGDIELCKRLVLALHPNAEFAGATFHVWSPDGEGALYAEFSDMEVEEALAFADSLTVLTPKEIAEQ